MDNKLTVEYKFTMNADKLTGKGAVENGWQEDGIRHRGEAGKENQNNGCAVL